MTSVFVVGLRHEPGELAKFAAFLGSKGVNIDSIAGLVHGDHAILTFVPDDAEATRKYLQEAEAPHEEYEALTLAVPNRPGELAKVAQALGDAGANMTSILPLPRGDEVELAVTFEDLEKARKVLD